MNKMFQKTLSKGYIQMANKHVGKYSTLLAAR